MELNPSQEGFYNGERYSSETGMARPDETHTVEDARAMGYEVIPITRNEYGEAKVDSLDKPYLYDRWLGQYEFNHIEGNKFEFDGENYKFLYTEISDQSDEHRAWFENESGTSIDFGF